MKNYLLLIFLLVCNTGAYAQKIHFTDSGNHWKGFDTDESFPQMPTGAYPWDFFGNRDTLYNGLAYKIFAGAGPNRSVLVREDTLAGKVYAVYLYTGITHDSAEQVMYDYSLVPGDTLFTHLGSTQFASMVLDTGSVVIGNQNYRVQFFVPVICPGFPQNYYVIEGIGSLSMPTEPLVPDREFPSYLTCFYHNGIQPAMVDAIAQFDNNTSCRLGVQDATSVHNFTIAPNPAHAITTIIFPEPFTGTLQVSGSDGRLYKTIPVAHAQQVLLDCSDLAAGSYLAAARSSENAVWYWQRIAVL